MHFEMGTRIVCKTDSNSKNIHKRTFRHFREAKEKHPILVCIYFAYQCLNHSDELDFQNYENLKI